MARRPKQVIEDDTTFTDEPSDVERIFQELPDDEESISLFRMYDQGRPKFVDKLQPQEFDLREIKKRYGGGRYKVVHKEMSKYLEIEGEPVLAIPKASRDEETGIFVKRGETIERVVEPERIYTRNWDELNERLRDIEQGNNKKGTNANDTLELVKTVLSLTQQGDSRKEIFEQLGLLKGLMSPQNPIQMQTGEIMNILKLGKEMASNMAEDGGSKWIDIIERVLNSPLAATVGNMVRNSSAVTGRPINPPAVPTKETVISSPPPDQPLTGFATVAPYLQPYLPMFMASAAALTEPVELVNSTVSLIPIDKYPLVANWLNSPTWFQDLLTLDPRIEAQSGWWQGFREELLGAFQEQQEQAQTQGTSNGQPGNDETPPG